MRLLAGLLAGVFAYLAVGHATGYAPRLELRLRPADPERIGRRKLWLMQAGLDVSPTQFALGSAAAGAGAFVLVALVTGAAGVAVVPAVTVGVLPRIWFARRRATRMRELHEAWPDGIRHVLGGIGSGLAMPQAVAELATTGPRPLREAFSRFAVTARMVGTVAALEVVKEQLADPTSDRVIEVMILAHERGGRIVPEVLRDLAEATSRDLKAAEEIETSRLEQKINSRAVFVLPWLVLVILTAVPGPFREFYQSVRGLAVVLGGGLMSLGGMWLVARLARDAAEERVFGSDASPVLGLDLEAQP